MLKELTTAIILTLVFSVGVGVLFIRTIVEMVEIFFTSENPSKENQDQQLEA